MVVVVVVVVVVIVVVVKLGYRLSDKSFVYKTNDWRSEQNSQIVGLQCSSDASWVPHRSMQCTDTMREAT